MNDRQHGRTTDKKGGGRAFLSMSLLCGEKRALSHLMFVSGFRRLCQVGGGDTANASALSLSLPLPGLKKRAMNSDKT